MGNKASREKAEVQIDGLLKDYERGYRDEMAKKKREEGGRCEKMACMRWVRSLCACWRRSRVLLLVLLILAFVAALAVVVAVVYVSQRGGGGGDHSNGSTTSSGGTTTM